jgi:general secretion pathway protein H
MNAHGYSLLEMLVVLAILGLIAAVAIPPIGTSIDHMRLSDDARILAGALREAREDALNQQRDVALTIDPQAPNKLASSARAQWTLSADGVTSFIAADGKPRAFAFHGDGTASGGIFRIAHGKAHTDVRVDDISGAVEVTK